jgi:pyroglutamyl-peptidase
VGRTTVLLTGFQPFPTQPVNATAALAPDIADAARAAFPDVRVVVEILPTEWRRGPSALEASLHREQPDVAIFFGIASRAKGFEIEMRGRNARGDSLDAAGFEPDASKIWHGGPEYLPATLPTSEVVRRLRRRGIPVIPSRNAGVYVCNALLFHALSVAGSVPFLEHVGFVHLPAELGIPGRRQTPVNQSCPITWEQAVIGGVEIVGACIGRPAPQAAARVRPRRFTS